MTGTHTCCQRCGYPSTPSLAKHPGGCRSRGKGHTLQHTEQLTITKPGQRAITLQVIPLQSTGAELYCWCCCRKRRLYACQDISTLVSKAGVEATQLLGLGSRWSELEVFDDTSYESRTAEQWVPSIPGDYQHMHIHS